MKVTWHSLAIQDLQLIFTYIFLENPQAARRILEEIEDQIDILSDYPQVGRHGRVSGTRELVIVRTPFIAVYQILEKEILILRILHGAKQWPPLDS